MQKQAQLQQLNNLIETRENEILELTRQNAERVAKTEIALMEFELLMTVNLTQKEEEKLTATSRNLRGECWKELSKKFNNNIETIQQNINSI